MKDRNDKKFILIAGIGVVVFLFVIVMALVSSHSAKESAKSAQRAQRAQGNGQLPFSGLTANVANNLRHQIDSIASNVNKGQQEIWEALKRKKAALLKAQEEQSKQKAVLNDLNSTSTPQTPDNSQLDALKKEIAAMSSALKEKQVSFTHQINQLKDEITHQYQIGQGQKTASQGQHYQGVTWVTDMTNANALNKTTGDANDPLRDTGNNQGKGFQLFDTTPLHERGHKSSDADAQSGNAKASHKPVAIPAFTIPNPTVLTRAIALTPIVGRIPKGDNHLVWAPFQVLFMVEHPNLTSNGHHLAPQMGKMLGTATCVGDLLAGANACHVDVLTYVFPDGTIATAKADDDAKNNGNSSRMDFKGFGYITDAYGNPQIAGSRKTALGLRIAMTGATAAVSAYGGALSQASTIQSNNGMGSIVQQVTNANKYAMGQAINGAAQGVNKEWEDVSKNMFDYIYTNNWNQDTHQLKRFNIVVTQQLDFDYVKHGRKLSYDNQFTKGERDAHDLILG